VRFGKVAIHTGSPAIGVERAIYPRGEDGVMYVHGREPVDDIGLVILKEAPPVAPFALYAGDPDLEWLQREQRPLDFVGFGYNVVQGSFTAPGVKRHVRMKVVRHDAKRFFYGNGTKGTCKGDSGGPAFFLDERPGRDPVLKVVGITSAGRIGCNGEASDMRMDVYLPWIKARLL
jgi:hypothetical protein